jgi:hypothetical protein
MPAIPRACHHELRRTARASCATRSEACATTHRAQWRTRLACRMPELEWCAAIVFFLPGGSLFPFAIWAYKHRAWLVTRVRRALTVVLALPARIRFTR